MNFISSFYKLKVIAVISVVIVASCSKDDVVKTGYTQNLVAAFSISDEKHLVDSTIQFYNESIGPENRTSFEWDFGDGNSSTLKSPTHSYSEVDNFIVKLTIKNGSLEHETSKEISISLSNDIPNRSSLKSRLDALNGKIIVCAHRANYSGAPENSLKSISDAIINGIGMVELDIRQTKDGELILMHDATIDRTTNGSGNVSDFLLEELKQFNLYKDNGTLTNEKIPTLKEVLKLARGKIYIDLDIDKKASFSKVYSLVDQYGMLKQVLFYSSEFNVIKDMINLNNKNVLFMPIARNQNDFNQYSSFDIDVIQFNVDDASVLQQIKNKGWYIFRNAYVNTNTTPLTDNYAQLNEVISVGGSVVQTDNSIEVKTKLQSQNLND
ncbi:glycerophosphodiester phosphodiesterase family protein [Litoribaculum gwangyangense]|uniref:PKD domain-containing protein n=1 Tax=Litoribaculum gwangyangense TaxID=1130722 RepID=A0ABP9CEZ5_9FLAO